MFKFTFIPADSTAPETVLCQSTRSLAEHDVRLNHQRVITPVQLFRALFATAFDRGNRRNKISFNVYRSQTNAGVEFGSAEEAFVWTIDHLNATTGLTGDTTSGGSGTVKMEFTATGGYSVTRYMHNAMVEAAELTDAKLGICLGLSYTFNGGIIDSTA